VKILHIINTLETGGAQSVLFHLLDGWGDESDRHVVVSLRQRGQLSGRIEALGISVEHLDFLPGRVEWNKFAKLYHVIRSYQPDVVQTWLYHSDLLGSIVSRLAGHASIVWGVHHTTINKDSVRTSTWWAIRMLSLLSSFLPSRIICCSRSAYQSHIALGYPEQKMRIVQNGINTNLFHPDTTAGTLLRTELNLPATVKLIGMFARYHPQKDYDTLLRAAGILLKQLPYVHFLLAGNGVDELNDRLRDKIDQECLSANIHLLGERKDIPFLMAGITVSTLSSSYGEAMPQVIGEAMACGTPCVVTNVGDTADIIGNAGIVVAPKGPQALANAWQYVLELPEVEYASLCAQARDRMLQHFNIIKMISEYKNIYNEL
jgi:glycosyltransferase involved in cell wall biosynthesis